MKPTSTKSLPRSLSAKNVASGIVTNRLTPDEIYRLSKRQNDWGIEGYEVPRHYYDYHQVLWERKRTKILENHTHVWPPHDWPRDKEDDKIKHPPKRKNYLDDLYKWCHSYYDPKRAKELIENQEIDVKEYQPKREIDTRRRRDFLANEKKKAEWKKSRPAYPEYKSDAIDDVKAQIEEDKKKKEITFIQKMKERYTKERPQTSRCDRVTVVADAEFVGEQIPFYNTPEGEEGEDQKKKKLFYPDKTCTWYRSPAWKICKPYFQGNPNIKLKEDEHKEKVNEYLSSKGMTQKDLNLDLRKSFYNVTHHGEILYKMVPRTNLKDEEHYQQAKENNPTVYVGPQHYWRMPKESRNPKKNKEMMQVITDDNGNKVYYMDRRKTDKFVYKSGMRKSVY